MLVDITTQNLKTGARSGILRGGEQFQKIVKFFKGGFKSIKGRWYSGTNLDKVNKLTGEGMSLEKAVKETWTAEQAGKAGFKNVKVGETVGTPGKYTSVEVNFTRKK